MRSAAEARNERRMAAVDMTFPLCGGVIESSYIEEDEYGFWPGFVVKMPDSSIKTVVISRDAEGNGPGHLFIEDR